MSKLIIITPHLSDVLPKPFPLDELQQSREAASIPLTKRWSFNNRLFARYRNELIFEES